MFLIQLRVSCKGELLYELILMPAHFLLFLGLNMYCKESPLKPDVQSFCRKLMLHKPY